MVQWFVTHPFLPLVLILLFLLVQVCRKIGAIFVPNLLSAIATDLRKTGTKLRQTGGEAAGIRVRGRYVFRIPPHHEGYFMLLCRIPLFGTVWLNRVIRNLKVDIVFRLLGCFPELCGDNLRPSMLCF